MYVLRLIYSNFRYMYIHVLRDSNDTTLRKHFMIFLTCGEILYVIKIQMK